jgi:hypothetical protein
MQGRPAACWDQNRYTCKVPAGSRIANGESSLWEDYHAVELAVNLKRLHTFFGPVEA